MNDNDRGGYPERYKLTFGVNNERERNEFDYNYNWPMNEPRYANNTETQSPLNDYKVENIDEPEKRGYILFLYFTEYASDYEPTISHSAVVMNADTLFRTNIGSPTIDGLKEEQYKILKNIIESLEFFDPVQPLNNY